MDLSPLRKRMHAQSYILEYEHALEHARNDFERRHLRAIIEGEALGKQIEEVDPSLEEEKRRIEDLETKIAKLKAYVSRLEAEEATGE